MRRAIPEIILAFLVAIIVFAQSENDSGSVKEQAGPLNVQAVQTVLVRRVGMEDTLRDEESSEQPPLVLYHDGTLMDGGLYCRLAVLTKLDSILSMMDDDELRVERMLSEIELREGDHGNE
jgi:hypothetical protein